MVNGPCISIATHDGCFHADDVLAMAILTTVFPHHRVIRTRDFDVLDMMDIVMDVGDVYDHRLRRYDHHMANPPTDRDNHILSSAGLIWRHYAKAYLKAIGIPSEITIKNTTVDLIASISKHIRVHWITPIDRADNGLAQGPTSISELVRSMRPTDPEKSKESYDTAFLDAVSMVAHIFKRSCFHSADHVITKIQCIQEKKTLLDDGKIVISKHPVHSYTNFYDTEAHFVICPTKEYKGSESYFVIRPMLDPVTKTYKSAFPVECLGTRRDDLAETLAIDGVSYIHHTGFTAHADTEESAIALCRHILGKPN